ncbi:acetylxylan esterase [Microbacterium lushaniae]|uniref:Acetylxylan esterase n=2 Tax=Microbacterium lushaniae TaxID=2614639 RepID=A0A5J6L337_9MICO|nr:acetylxylan esterase [Microbacterium lushaniae]
MCERSPFPPSVVGQDGPMDPTYGYTIDTLLAVQPPVAPADFAEYWGARYARARAIDPTPVLRPSAQPAPPGTRLYDVEFSTTDGLRLGGWLTLPAEGRIERGLVVSHGYGGRLEPEHVAPVEHAAVLYACARGMGARSLIDDIPSIAERHVLHGIADRDTYVHGGCAADVWCSVSALTELVPAVAGRVAYVGGSFGGGIGALALPWEDRISAACLSIPSFGHHPLRVTMPCTGSGESVRRRVEAHPETMDVLRYFDAATAATMITIPTHVAPALADPAVPPPGQFAIANGLAGEREVFVRATGHMDHPDAPDEAEALRASQRDFLART